MPLKDTDSPLDYVRLGVAFLLVFGTIISLVFWVLSKDSRFFQVVIALWAVYGLVTSLVNGIMDEFLEGLGRMLASVGLQRAGEGISAAESLAIRGKYDEAAESLRLLAQENSSRIPATLRRAELLAGPLGNPEAARAELTALQQTPLSIGDDLRVGLALVNLYDRRLDEPGRAMAELRRLIDRHGKSARSRDLRIALAALKREHFESEE